MRGRETPTAVDLRQRMFLKIVKNALSEKLDLTIFRDEKEYFISFKNGKTVNPIKFVKKTKKSGTKINFLASTTAHLEYFS